MSTLHKITFTKTELDKIPDPERLFYFMAGQLSNDINLLTKHVIFATNEISFVGSEEGKRSAAIAQLLMTLKMLAGRLYEGKTMINKTFSAKKLHIKYASDMTEATSDSLKKLNAYFGGQNIIHIIRTQFAFHLDSITIRNIYNEVADNFEFTEYLSPIYTGHNLFGSSETLCMNAIVGASNPNWQDKINSFVLDVTTVSMQMGTFLSGFMGLLLDKYLGLSAQRINDGAFTIRDDPAVDDVRLPFFCLPPSRSPEE